MKRAGALLVAVLMVGAAFYVRGATTDDDEAGGDGGDRPALLCPTELADVCRAVDTEVVTEAAGETADRLIEASNADALGAERWLVPAPWARLVLAERARLDQEPLFEVSAPVASSPVVQLVWRDIDRELHAECGAAEGESPGWRCVAQRADGPQFHVGAPAVDSAVGLPVAAAQMGFLIGRADYFTNDFEGDIPRLARSLAAGQVDDPVRVMRTRGPGQLAVVGTVAAQARQLSSTFGTLVPYAQSERVDLVLLHPADDGPGPTDHVVEAFRAAGWDAPVGGPDGLPSDGSVLAAVRTLWKENQR